MARSHGAKKRNPYRKRYNNRMRNTPRLYKQPTPQQLNRFLEELQKQKITVVRLKKTTDNSCNFSKAIESLLILATFIGLSSATASIILNYLLSTGMDTANFKPTHDSSKLSRLTAKDMLPNFHNIEFHSSLPFASGDSLAHFDAPLRKKANFKYNHKTVIYATNTETCESITALAESGSNTIHMVCEAYDPSNMTAILSSITYGAAPNKVEYAIPTLLKKGSTPLAAGETTVYQGKRFAHHADSLCSHASIFFTKPSSEPANQPPLAESCGGSICTWGRQEDSKPEIACLPSDKHTLVEYPDGGFIFR